MKKISYLFCIAAMLHNFVFSQDKPSIKNAVKGKGLSINGSITANNRYYTPFAIPARQAGFQYIYSGRLQADFFGKVKMPVTFSYTNQKAIFGAPSLRSALPAAQPFNRLSLKPRYKEHTAYLGVNSLTFSPYTLNGHRFNGVGYEYKSTKFPIYGGLQYGQFLKPVSLEAIAQNNLGKPAYGRMGYSGKLGYFVKDNFIEITSFLATDRLSSVKSRLDVKNIFAEQNLASSMAFQKVFKKKIYVGSTYARTVIGRVENQNPEGNNLLKTMFTGFNERNYKHALKSDISYKTDAFMVGGEYSWVDPNYRTFGGYFFNNDLETIALKSNYKFMKNTIDIKADIGRQRSNLDVSRPQSQNRWVYSLGTNYAPTEKFTLDVNYSTFSSFSNFLNQFAYLKAIDPFQDIDTLNYRQINRNFTANSSFVLPNKNDKIKNSLTGTFLLQSGNDQQGSATQQTQIVNGNFGLNRTNSKNNISQSVGINVVNSQLPTTTEWMFGPSIGFNAPLFSKKLQLTSNINYTFIDSQNLIVQGKSVKQVILGVIGLSTDIKKVHKIALNSMFLKQVNNKNKLLTGENFAENTLTLSYQYNFKLLDLKFK